MSSYVDQAILRVKDESTGPVSRINKALSDLHKAAGKGSNINIKGLDKLSKDMTALQKRVSTTFAALRRPVAIKVTGLAKVSQHVKDLNAIAAAAKSLSAQKLAFSIDVKAPNLKAVSADVASLLANLQALKGLGALNVRLPKPPGPAGGGAVPPIGGPRGAAAGGYGGGYNPLASAFVFSSAYMVINSAQLVVSSAFAAALKGQAQDTKLNVIIPEQDRAQVNGIAESIVKQTRRIDITEAERMTGDMYMGGMRGDVLAEVAPFFGKLLSGMKVLYPDKVDRMATLTAKATELANTVDDPVRSKAIMEGVMEAAAISGSEFNGPALLAVLRRSGIMNTITQEGIVGLSMAVDAQGEQAGANFVRLSRELTLPLKDAGRGGNVAKGVVENLIANGFRDADGLSDENRELLRSDPMKYVNTVMRNQLIAQGVKVDDPDAIDAALIKAGFNPTSSRLVADALASFEQWQRAMETSARLELSRVDTAAEKDFNSAIANFTASFNTLATRVLTPLLETLTPYVDKLADWVEKFAMDDSVPMWQKVTAAVGPFVVAIGGAVWALRLFTAALGLGSARAAVAGGGGALAGVAGGAAGAASAWWKRIIPAMFVGTAAGIVLGGGEKIKDTKTNSEMAAAYNSKQLPYQKWLADVTAWLNQETPPPIAATSATRRRGVRDDTQTRAFIADSVVKLAQQVAQQTADTLALPSANRSRSKADQVTKDIMASSEYAGGNKPLDWNKFLYGNKPPATPDTRTREEKQEQAKLRREAIYYANALDEALALSSANRDRGKANSVTRDMIASSHYVNGDKPIDWNKVLFRQEGDAIPPNLMGKWFGGADQQQTDLYNGDALGNVFSTGAIDFSEAVSSSLTVDAQEFGPTAAQGLLAQAPAIGAAIGAAAAAQMQNITVQARTSTTTPRLVGGVDRGPSSFNPQ